MPEAIAAALTYAGVASGTTALAIGYATTIIASVAYARSQERQARRQFNDGLEDHTQPVPQSDAARTFVYGRTRVSGPIQYHVNYGARRETVSHVIALAGHEITSVDDIWFGDRSIGTLPAYPGGEVATDSQWFAVHPEPRVMRSTGPAANGTLALDLDGSPLLGLDTLIYRTPTEAIPNPSGQDGTVLSGGNDEELKLGVDYSLSGSTVTFLTAKQQGCEVTATYRINRGHAQAAVYWRYGSAAGQRDTNLEAWSGGEWPSSSIGCNIATLHVVTTWEPTVYSTGFPMASAIVRGKKVYDPRKDSTNGGSGAHRADTPATWEYSDNPALCAADYARDSMGFGFLSAEIDWPSVMAAANICDELVPIDGAGAVQKRYVIAGVLSTEATRQENLESILDAMAGVSFWSAGKLTLRAGAYVAPTLDLSDADLAGGDITIVTAPPQRSRFNAVRGRYRAPDQLYQITDIPPYKSETYLAADGGGEYSFRAVDLPLVDDPIRAQRILKLVLHRARQELTVTANWKLPAYALQPADTVRLTIARYGWTNKVFRVLEREFAGFNVIRLVLQEEAAAVYSWAYNEATDPDPAPNTNLPDPRFVDIVSGLSARSDATTFYVRQDGAVVPYVELTWDRPDAQDVHVEIRWKRAGDLEYQRIVRPEGAVLAWLEGVGPGDLLNIYAEAVNAIGARSAISWIPSYRVAASSRSGRVVATANQLQNSTLDASVGGWTPFSAGVPESAVTVLKPTLANGYASGDWVPGTPTNLVLRIASALTGNGYVGACQATAFQVTPGTKYVIYGSVLALGTDAYLRLEWRDAAGAPISILQSNTAAGIPVGSLNRRFSRPEDYDLCVVSGIAPPGARLASFQLHASGNWMAGDLKHVSLFKPFGGVMPEGVTDLPPWSPGGANSIGDGLIATGAVTQIVEFSDPVGLTINNEGAEFADYAMTTATAQADGIFHASVTFQVDATATAGGASTVRAGLMATGKLELVSRTVFTVAAGTSNSTTVTLTADIPVTKGAVITPLLRLSRSRWGVGVGSTADRISLVSGRLKLHKA